MLEREELIQKVLQAGVVGAGGAGFPTHIKFQAEGIDTYLINCAECEPLLTVDQHLMLEQAHRLVETGKKVASAIGAARLLFGLKQKYTAQTEALRQAGAEVAHMGNFYPAGDEVIMIADLLGRTVPEGGLPLQVGVVVNNPETLLSVADALEGTPVTHKLVTVGGAVANRGIWRVPIGTPIADLLKAAGGPTIPNPVYLDGGPMTGKYFLQPDYSVGKATKGVLVVPRDSTMVFHEMMSVEHMLRQAKVGCIQCTECTFVCSRNLIGYKLEPHKLMRMAAYTRQGLPDIAKQAFLCSECNLCSGFHACPMKLSPKRLNQVLKGKLREAGIRPDFSKREIEPQPRRSYRLLQSSRLERRLGLDRYHGTSPYYGDCVMPELLSLKTRQGAGSAIVPEVQEGQEVQKGQFLGAPPAGALGSRLHSPVIGTVVRVASDTIEIRPVRV